MQAIVSLLDLEHQDRIAAVHERVERAVGVQGFCVTPIPHLSYHVADEYDPDMLAALLLAVAGSKAGFSVRTSGLGMFTAGHAVVYIPVVRSPTLMVMHQVLWRQLGMACISPSRHYHPDNWLPHITLLDNPALSDHLPEVMQLLREMDFNWQIEIGNIALLYGQGEALGLRFEHPLRGGGISEV